MRSLFQKCILVLILNALLHFDLGPFLKELNKLSRISLAIAMESQVDLMKAQTQDTIEEMKNQVSTMQNIENQRESLDKKLRMQKTCTQLEGAKNEILDLYMSLDQSQLECVRLGFIKANYTLDPGEFKMIDEEYFRKRSFSDNLIIDVAKSGADLIKILSSVSFYFRSELRIDDIIKRIIQNHYDLKRKLEESEKKLRKSLNELSRDLGGDNLEKETSNREDTQIRNISSFISSNIINEIDTIINYMKKKLKISILNRYKVRYFSNFSRFVASER
jgi:hypothetical protein